MAKKEWYICRGDGRMKRLTKRIGSKVFMSHDNCVYKNTSLACNITTCYNVALNRLAEYEDMEEQGLLVRLPCKVGDTVYWIMECSCRNIDGVYSKCEFYGYEPDYGADCEICNRPEGTKCPHQYRISAGRAKEQNILMIARNLGKTVFLTREEAEKALEEACRKNT